MGAATLENVILAECTNIDQFLQILGRIDPKRDNLSENDKLQVIQDLPIYICMLLISFSFSKFILTYLFNHIHLSSLYTTIFYSCDQR